MIGVVPTGTANLASVLGAWRRLGASPVVLREPDQVASAPAVVVPGVGAFGAAMRALEPFVPALRRRVEEGRPTLGVCLGMQVFGSGSDETPGVSGVGAVPGRVVHLGGPRVPHLGWTRVRGGAGVVTDGDAFFAHSYAFEAAPPGWTTALATGDGGAVVAAVERGPVVLCQFHPELSGVWGAALLGRWWDLARGLPLRPSPAASPRGSAAARRVIPCLDVKDGRVVKGVRFAGLRDAGDPAERAAAYVASGADQLVVLDVSATDEGRAAGLATVRAVRAVADVPLTVGGGVRSAADAARLLEAGADQVGVNTAAVRQPSLLGELARTFGSQCTLLALDAARSAEGGWEVVIEAGRRRIGRDAVAWAREAVDRGAGEILLTSWDRDGTGLGYDLELLAAVRAAVGVPVVASGGARSVEHLVEAIRAGADAVLVASILHDGVTDVGTLKRSLAAAGVEVRP